MQEISLNDLVSKTKEVIKSGQYRQSTLTLYDYGWRGICEYFSDYETTWFSSVLVTQYIMETRQRYVAGDISLSKFKLIRKTATMLIQCHETGSIQWNKIPSWDNVDFKTPLYSRVMCNYIKDLNDKEYGFGTIKLCKTVTKKFLTFLEQKKTYDLSVLKPDTVSHFILYASKDYQPTSMRTVCTALRSFLRFLVSAELIPNSLVLSIPSSFARKTTIIPTITRQEEDQMLAAIDRNTMMGKRDYAILLIALRLGIRSVDITNLKLEQVKWQRNTIELIQQKTGHILMLPLLADVGNAIIDYLIHGRHASSEPYVFLRSHAPYTKLSGNAAVYHVVSGYMEKAHIRQNKGERKGAHCLRHTVASRLLSSETPLPIISSILGHADKNSALVYLSTDLEHLRSCALGLAGIEVVKEELKP